jgi:hypothetical protein
MAAVNIFVTLSMGTLEKWDRPVRIKCGREWGFIVGEMLDGDHKGEVLVHIAEPKEKYLLLGQDAPAKLVKDGN